MRKTKIVSTIILLVGLSFNVCHATPTLLRSLTVHGHTYALYSAPQVAWYRAEEFAYALGDDWTLATIPSMKEQIVVSGLIDSEKCMAIRASGFGMLSWNNEGTLRHIRGFFAEQTPGPVPEPSTLLLLGGGMIALAGLQRKSLKTLSHHPR